MAARRLHNLIYITIANCCIFLIVCSVSLGTNQWFKSSTKGGREEGSDGSWDVRVEVSYGLFAGTKTKYSVAITKQSLKIYCQGFKGCMFSCGKTSQMRKQDFDDLNDKKTYQDHVICINEPRTLLSRSFRDLNFTTAAVDHQRQNIIAEGSEEDSLIFINFGLYLATIVFLALGMIFSILSGVFALYNTYRTPIQPILSVFGLYIWNGISAAFVLLAMIMWVIEFATRLRKNAAISDTLSGVHDSSGIGSLGVSFWILILPICFALANIVILKYRKWKIIKMEEQNVRVMTEKLESGDILLF